MSTTAAQRRFYRRRAASTGIKPLWVIMREAIPSARPVEQPAKPSARQRRYAKRHPEVVAAAAARQLSEEFMDLVNRDVLRQTANRLAEYESRITGAPVGILIEAMPRVLQPDSFARMSTPAS